MTEFEIATLAYQQASLALRESALWVAVAQVAASLAIGIGQIAVVWYGIRAMQRAGTQRAYEQDQRHADLAFVHLAATWIMVRQFINTA